MPPKERTWEKLPHQREIFDFDVAVFDGAAHSLAAEDKMPKFQKHWEPLGGLPAFQEHLSKVLARISEPLIV